MTLSSLEFVTKSFPRESIAIPTGVFPVVAKILDTPVGVIFDTVPLLVLMVYMFPAGSRTISFGLHPVVPRMLCTPRGVIFMTVLFV